MLLFFSFLFLPPLHYIIALRLSLSSVPLGLPLWASLSAFSVLVIHTHIEQRLYSKDTRSLKPFPWWNRPVRGHLRILTSEGWGCAAGWMETVRHSNDRAPTRAHIDGNRTKCQVCHYINFLQATRSAHLHACASSRRKRKLRCDVARALHHSMMCMQAQQLGPAL